MKKLILLLISKFFIDVNAQNTYQCADIGAVWHLANNGFFGLGYQKMTYEKDTIINNQYQN